MTAARRRRKPRAGLSRLALWLAVVAPAVGWQGRVVTPANAATTQTTTQYVVVDRHSGLAIDGFDPVAYFVDGGPVLGKGEFELSFAGATWRFRNEGNRAAFAAHPEIYMPRFGGYDPVAVARGLGVAGNPRFWIVSDARLYLFYGQDSRAAFAVDQEGLSTTAERKWPSVQLTLAP